MPPIEDVTELESVDVRLLSLQPGTTARIDVAGPDRSAELAWTRQKAHSRSLRVIVVTAGCPSIPEHGFDVVHKIVESAAKIVGESGGTEVGAIDVAICGVADPSETAQSISRSDGPWELPSLGGATLRIIPGADRAQQE